MKTDPKNIENVLVAINKLFELLDRKKTKEERRKAILEVYENFFPTIEELIDCNILNSQLPPDPNERQQLEKASKVWKKFRNLFIEFRKLSDDGENEKAKKKLERAKIRLEDFRKIIQGILQNKQEKLEKFQEEQDKEDDKDKDQENDAQNDKKNLKKKKK